MRDGIAEMLVYWSAGNFSNTQRLPFSLIMDLYRIHSVFLKPPLNYFDQKRPPTLIGNVPIVNLKLHNSEIEVDILQKCKNVI